MAGFRIVVITKKAKLDYKFSRLKIRDAVEEDREIFLDEISVLVVENTSVSLTAYLLNELAKRNIKVIFCDEKHNPSFETVNIYGSYDTARKLKKQIEWNKKIKVEIWTEIIKMKIESQEKLLVHIGKLKRAEKLKAYRTEIKDGDNTNREAMAARIYFNSLFDNDWTRDDDSLSVNAMLDYGYTILNSAFNRDITSAGFHTALGLWHRGGENPFNLSSDLMEPFRPLIDKFVYENKNSALSKEIKYELVNLLNSKMKIDGQIQTVLNGITIYAQSIFGAMESKDKTLIKNFDLINEV
jgi:CRISPR-associated endonuclease Cas1 subtype II